MLKHKKTLILTTLVLLLPMVAGALLWSRLPEQLPTHWNAAGEVDQYSSKAFALFGLPGILLAIHWLCVLGTGLDPKQKNHTAFLQRLVLWICPVLSVLLCGIMLCFAMGGSIRVEILLPVLIGLLLVIIGNYMPKCKQNYTIGIKLPWTLDSEENWNATHRFGGFVWVIGGFAIMAASLLIPNAFAWVLLPVVILIVLIPTVYSYLYYRKHR